MTAEPRPEGDLSDTRVGAFTLTRRLAVGSAADVYLAAAVGAAMPAAAVKIVRHGTPAAAAAAVRSESAVLATLRHPGIAELLEHGVSPDGRPFVSTRFVDGLHLDDHCAQNGLTVPAMLELLARVADAVGHAHAAGVVHGDLKPANIVVGPAGQPCLIDFGAARVDSRRDTTSAGDGPMTPWYASPEVLAGAAKSPRSDVFAIGVILRDLLPSSPATACRSRRAGERLAARCLDPHAPERPSCGQELAAALRLAAAGRSPWPRPWTVARMRRHAAIAVWAAAGLAVAAAIWQTIASGRQGQLARAEALAVSEFLVRLLDQAGPDALGADVTLPAAWQSAEALIPTTFAGRPSAEARVRMAYGRAWSRIGDRRQAALHLQRAIDLLVADPDADPRSIAWCEQMLRRCRTD